MRRKPRPPRPDPRPQWMIDQGARCGCRGSDDLCVCQNEQAPWKYGLGPKPETPAPAVREIDCPRCHQQCGWCSDYRWMHATLTLPGTGRRCRIAGMEPEGDNCPLCAGSRRVIATTTYAKAEARA